jgi:hypothetical protein
MVGCTIFRPVVLVSINYRSIDMRCIDIRSPRSDSMILVEDFIFRSSKITIGDVGVILFH